MTEAITRSIDLKEVTETRTFTGIVAPYGEVIEVAGYRERYEPGLFADAPNVQIYYNHSMIERALPIGRIESYRETEAGLEVTGRISETSQGNEVYALMRDGVLDSLSAQFVPTQSRDDDGVTVYERAELLEVSVVSKSAYPSARISEVRNDTANNNNTKEEVLEEDSDTTVMTEANYDDSELRSGLDALEREISLIKERGNDTPAAESNIRSYGEYVKAYARGDDEAKAIARAWEGGTSADSVLTNGWDTSLVKVLDESRPVTNVVAKGTLPASGTTIEYAKLGTDTTQVAVQANEGDTLVYGKVAVTSDSTPLRTVGGWTSLTRQEIDRASVNIVDTAWQALSQKYARETERLVRAAVLGATAHEVDGDIATFGGVTGFFVDAAMHLNDLGLSPEFLLVSPDVFKELVGFSTDSDFILSRNNGSVNVTALNANVLGVPAILVPGTGIATLGHSSAVKVFESAGAPFNLTDGDITNLTGAMSVYGYHAVAVQNADALVTVGAA